MTFDPTKPNELPDVDEATIEKALAERWTDEMNTAALREGWTIFTCYGSVSGPVQVQAIDSPDDVIIDVEVPMLADDDVAMLLVMRGTAPHHVMARELIKELNPEDYQRMEHVLKESS
jgi:hypothetical protein